MCLVVAGRPFGHLRSRPQVEDGVQTLRPSFTVILWGCGMALWPRMLQHIHSHVDGDISVAALRMPGAEAEPFVKAIMKICAPLSLFRIQRSLSLLSVSADGVHCARLCGSQTVTTLRAERVDRTSANRFAEKDVAQTARPDLGSVSGG